MSQAFATHDYLAGALTEVAAPGESLPQAPEARLARWPWLAATLTILLHTIFLLLGSWLGGVTDRSQRESLPPFISVHLNNRPAEEEGARPEAVLAKQPALLAGNTAWQNRASSSARSEKESSQEYPAPDSGGLGREGTHLAEPAAGGNALPSPAAAAQRSGTVAGAQQGGPAEVLARPLYAVNPPPRYPQLAKRLGKQGSVLLEIFVSASGTVEEVKVASGSGHEMLDTAALETVRGWRFAPGLRNGQPVGMWVRVPVRFELHG